MPLQEPIDNSTEAFRGLCRGLYKPLYRPIEASVEASGEAATSAPMQALLPRTLLLTSLMGGGGDVAAEDSSSSPSTALPVAGIIATSMKSSVLFLSILKGMEKREKG